MHQLCLLFMLNYPAIHSLSERERAASHIQETLFTIARLKIFPAIDNLIYEYLDMIQSIIICSIQIHNLCKWLDCNATTWIVVTVLFTGAR